MKSILLNLSPIPAGTAPAVSKLAVIRSICMLAVILTTLLCARPVRAQCDDDYQMDCQSSQPCNFFDCSGTPGGPPSNPGSPSGPSGTTGPSGTSGGITPAQDVAAIKQRLQILSKADGTWSLDWFSMQPNTYLVVRDSYTQQPKGMFVNLAGRLPILQAQATQGLSTRIPLSEPVAGDGEFVVDETDISLPGLGIPFEFSRHYRSGVDYQTSLGFGWNHNFNQRLVNSGSAFIPVQGAATPTQPDMYLIDDRLQQVRFIFQTTTNGNDVFTLASPGTMVLTHPHNDPTSSWLMTNGDGLTYVFDGSHGYLIAIKDKADHALQIDWSAQPIQPITWAAFKPKVVDVVDTTGRVIYFNYAQAGLHDNTWFAKSDFEDDPEYVDGYESVGDSGVEYLQCLSLKPTCDNPLVSFQIKVIAALSDRLPDTRDEADAQLNIVNYTLEFDLVGVKDSRGYGPSYKYFQPATPLYGSYLVYQKQFDQYWPSSSATEIYNYIKSLLPATERDLTELGIECFMGADAAVAAQQLGPTCEGDITCFNFFNNKTELLKLENSFAKSCIKGLPDYVKQLKSRIPAAYAYGIPPDEYHNLIEADDAYGNPVVQNVYGDDPFSPSFDRVTQQTLGKDPTNVTTYRYFLDLQHKLPPNPLNSFTQSLEICPTEGSSYLPAYARATTSTDPYQMPTLEIESVGPLGRKTTMYLDVAGRVLRQIDAEGLSTDYNYRTTGASAIQIPTGLRKCLERDQAGKVTKATTIPREKVTGGNLVTAMTYDAAEEVVQESHASDNGLLSSTAILRDPWERVVGIGEEVDSLHTRWTCFQYTDAQTSLITPAIQGHLTARFRLMPTPAPAPTGIRGVNVGGSGRFDNPCIGLLKTELPISSIRAAIPSLVIRPDGTNIELSNFKPTGPQEIVVDATGSSPVDHVFAYDFYGRLSETALRDFSTGQLVPASITKWDTDVEGLVEAVHVPDPNNPTNFIDTTYTYDFNRRVQTVTNPLLTRAFSNDVFGNVLNVTETPSGGNGASGLVQTSCFKYDAYGDMVESISPEGNVTDFAYDPVGHVTQVSMGPRVLTVGFGQPSDAPCVAKVINVRASRTGAPSPRETVSQFAYNANEQLSSTSKNGTTVQYAYDGFGRLVDAVVSDHMGSTPVAGPRGIKLLPLISYHHVIGYSGENEAWTAIADSYPTGGTLPPYLTKGIHAAEEYSYDMVGRPTQVRQWQFKESPSLTAETPQYAATNYVYDDSHNSVAITDPLNTVYFNRMDGADRIVETVKAQGAPEQMSTLFNYSNAGTVVNSSTTPHRPLAAVSAEFLPIPQRARCCSLPSKETRSFNERSIHSVESVSRTCRSISLEITDTTRSIRC